MSSRRFRDQPLHRAVALNRIVDISELLKKNTINIDSIDSDTGHSPLSLAITLQQIDVVRFLIESGANFNASVRLTDRQSPRRQPLIHLATVSVHAERLLPIFVAAGADLSALDEHGLTVCHYAAHMSDAKVLSQLIALGAPTSVRDATALRQLSSHYAARNANASVMMALIAAGADCESADADGLTPCHFAARNASEQVITLLIAAGVPVDVPDSHGECASHLAAENRNCLVMARLIAAGCDVSRVNSRGQTPLSCAALRGNDELLPLLMAAGAPPPAKLAASISKQEAAVSTSNFDQKSNESILPFVCGRASIDDRDKAGRTAVHRAAEEGDIGSIRALVSCGASINTVDYAGLSVCHTAALHEDRKVLATVLALGADLEQCDRVGRTPCHLAVCEDMYNRVFALLNAGANINSATPRGVSMVYSAAALDYWSLNAKNTLRLLLDRGADFRRADVSGQTAMHHASAGGVVLLFASGANLNAFNNGGKLPCHIAIYDQGDSFATLVAAGADLRPPDDVRWPHERVEPEQLALLIAGGGEVAAVVPSELIDAACFKIVARQNVLMQERALQVCLGLHSLDLPALVTCEILSFAFTPLESLVKFHDLWSLVTKVKHFSRAHDEWLSGLLEVNLF